MESVGKTEAKTIGVFDWPGQSSEGLGQFKVWYGRLDANWIEWVQLE